MQEYQIQDSDDVAQCGESTSVEEDVVGSTPTIVRGNEEPDGSLEIVVGEHHACMVLPDCANA